MLNTNCYDFAMKFAFAKEIEFVLTTHYTETESERTDFITCEKYPEYDMRYYEVVMCAATKKNCFRVYGYREV